MTVKQSKGHQRRSAPRTHPSQQVTGPLVPSGTSEGSSQNRRLPSLARDDLGQGGVLRHPQAREGLMSPRGSPGGRTAVPVVRLTRRRAAGRGQGLGRLPAAAPSTRWTFTVAGAEVLSRTGWRSFGPVKPVGLYITARIPERRCARPRRVRWPRFGARVDHGGRCQCGRPRRTGHVPPAGQVRDRPRAGSAARERPTRGTGRHCAALRAPASLPAAEEPGPSAAAGDARGGPQPPQWGACRAVAVVPSRSTGRRTPARRWPLACGRWCRTRCAAPAVRSARPVRGRRSSAARRR